MAIRKTRSLTRVASGSTSIGELFKIVRELSFDELREEAETPPRLLLVGGNGEVLRHLREALGGGVGGGSIETATFEQLPSNLDLYDGIVLVNAGPPDRNRPRIRQLLNDPETAGRTLTFQLPPGDSADGKAPPPAAAVDDLRGRLVTRLSHRQLALGRHLPTFRKQVTTSLINQTSRANAEFALLSNIPAVIPVVGNFMSAGADFLVLTKNQLMLVYKLAAIHGRDIDHPWRLYTELLPVVGAGLVWRTAARELAALLPLAAGTIPKVVVAYTGTVVTGQAANYYYELGKRPSGEQLRLYYERAAEIARSLAPGARDDRDVIEGRFTEAQQPDPADPSPTPPVPLAPPVAGTRHDGEAAR